MNLSMNLTNRAEFDSMTTDEQFTELQRLELQKHNAEETVRFLLADLDKAERQLAALGSPWTAPIRAGLSRHSAEARRLMAVGRAVSEGRAA